VFGNYRVPPWLAAFLYAHFAASRTFVINITAITSIDEMAETMISSPYMATPI
jgi:hypothetical protein